ncbi:hypothetical protein TWF730_008306 [Orbilia blumenaviensis]|uniref:Calcineurin-like phosphoesterase domain-containing protein n=1 Tax=Orbilia blumenaviensis TaxID=1796055 RepID=A0AAV9V298_9PEZI
MPAAKKPRRTNNRINVLTADVRKPTTTTSDLVEPEQVHQPRHCRVQLPAPAVTSPRRGKAEKADTQPKVVTCTIATRSAVRDGRLALVEATNNLNIPRLRRRKQIIDSGENTKPTDPDVLESEELKELEKPADEQPSNPTESLKSTTKNTTEQVKTIQNGIKILSLKEGVTTSVEKRVILGKNTAENPIAVKTSFLLVSDTHDVQPRSSEFKDSPFRDPFPRTDVFIHAGDMTQQSSLSALKTVISWIERVPAELKILIAGNHDTCLDIYKTPANDPSDPDAGSDTEGERDNAKMECRKYLKSELMNTKGIFYLEHEVKTFNLKNGASLTVFASPYTPRGPRPHHSGAFRYNSDVNFWQRFSKTGVLGNKKIDVTVLHGPAFGILDTTSHGKDVGCMHLREFLKHIRPLMNVCGHIHEAAGVKIIEWDNNEKKDVEIRMGEEDGAIFTDARAATKEVTRGGNTLFVNASLVGWGSSSYAEAARSPYVVELDLPLAAV